MPQIFRLARSIAKGNPGETPMTQVTPALQAKLSIALAHRIVDINVRAKHYWIDIRTNSTRCR